MHHFFIDKNNISGSEMIFPAQDYVHMTKVLRLKLGEKVSATDGINNYIVSINFIGEEVKGEIIATEPATVESPIRTIVVQALAKGEKMDFIIQKVTELGANEILPVESMFSIVKLDNKKKKERTERWQKIAYEAAKQSKRAIVPHVEMPMTLEEAFRKLPTDALKIVLWESEDTVGLANLYNASNNITQVALIIGPEGGFSEEEIILAQRYGIKSVSLGKRILRTETAGIAALAITQFVLGDLGGKY